MTVIVRKYYKLLITADTDVASFDFNSLMEVKKFVSHIDENAFGGSYTMTLWEMKYTWDMSAGSVTSSSTQVLDL